MTRLRQLRRQNAHLVREPNGFTKKIWNTFKAFSSRGFPDTIFEKTKFLNYRNPSSHQKHNLFRNEGSFPLGKMIMNSPFSFSRHFRE